MKVFRPDGLHLNCSPNNRFISLSTFTDSLNSTEFLLLSRLGSPLITFIADASQLNWPSSILIDRDSSSGDVEALDILNRIDTLLTNTEAVSFNPVNL